MSKEELVKQQFGNNAEKYVKSKIHAKGPDLQYVVQQVESRHNNRLLDIATGARTCCKCISSIVSRSSCFRLNRKNVRECEKLYYK